jgi:hypothetical protein
MKGYQVSNMNQLRPSIVWNLSDDQVCEVAIE